MAATGVHWHVPSSTLPEQEPLTNGSNGCPGSWPDVLRACPDALRAERTAWFRCSSWHHSRRAPDGSTAVLPDAPPGLAVSAVCKRVKRRGDLWKSIIGSHSS